METFSERHGYNRDIPITTREAHEALRTAVIDVAYRLGMKPSALRTILCRVLFETPNRNNWSETPNIDEEARGLMTDAAWYEVYDVIEQISIALSPNPHPMFPSMSAASREFESELNRLFKRRGIGWQIRDRRVEYRGEEGVAAALDEAPQMLAATGRVTATTELNEAVKDLGRRSSPEVTGAIQHAMAALECVARSGLQRTRWASYSNDNSFLSQYPFIVRSRRFGALRPTMAGTFKRGDRLASKRLNWSWVFRR